jgi:hypothetical protein
MNLKAFVYGLLSGQKGNLLTEHATSFTETLAILMDAGIQSPFNRTVFQTQLSALVGRIERDTTTEGSGKMVDKLRQMFKDFLPEPALGSGPTPTPTDEIPIVLLSDLLSVIALTFTIVPLYLRYSRQAPVAGIRAPTGTGLYAWTPYILG